MEYSRYRVKSTVKSFRDLEVYQKTILLSDEITSLLFLNKKTFEKDNDEIKFTAEKIPKLIAEAYGDRFDSRELAHKKLTEALTLITDIITKIDLLREKFTQDKEAKEALDKLLTKYQAQKRKALNLRRAWDRVFTNAREGSKSYKKS
ncbi:hypothetical protein FP803_04865 [Candidatus Woesearchaeota archaeon]|nr:hypothetical protein [Candidatus Woesearchaeota archaeon]